MKRIRLLSLPDPKFPQNEGNRVDYRSTIEECMRVPLNRQEGATIDEMRRGIRVLDALDAARDDVLELEDADWEFLKQKIERMPWAYADRRFVQLYDDVTGATDAVRDPAHANGAA